MSISHHDYLLYSTCMWCTEETYEGTPLGPLCKTCQEIMDPQQFRAIQDTSPPYIRSFSIPHSSTQLISCVRETVQEKLKELGSTETVTVEVVCTAKKKTHVRGDYMRDSWKCQYEVCISGSYNTRDVVDSALRWRDVL